MALSPGTRLGPYEILAPIGVGGMGEVYKARDTRLDRIVAIKVANEKFSERFEREARAVAALNHPHICTLHDVGPNYLVMEYIEGQPLRGPLPLNQALRYASQICDALDAAHRRGITHRDLKPDNILVTKGTIKLLDFGLATMVLPQAEAGATATMALSSKGTVIGTLQYMSPEQLEGKEADARSDVYSLGLVLYEMLTGKRAFPLTSLESLNPPALDRVVKTCIAHDPEERWQTAREVKIALDPVSTPSPVVQPRRARLYWVAIAALAVLLAAALFLGRKQTADQSLTRFAVYPPEKTNFSGSAVATVPVPQFALSPDGGAMVFPAAPAGAKPLLWLRSMEDLAARPLAGTENAQDPFWSPDGRWVGFFADGKLAKIPAAGGAVQVITQGLADSFGGSWGQDETILIGTGVGPIFRVSSAGGTPSPVTKLDKSRQERTHRWPQFLPDGRHFLFLVQSVLDEQAGVYAGDLNRKEAKLLVRTNSNAVYAPPGYLLWVEGDALLGQALDAQRLQVSAERFAVAERVGRSSTFQAAVSASRNGSLAYSSPIFRLGSLTWFDRNGSSFGSVGPEGDYVDFRLSPDEKHLAVALGDLKTSNPDIWLTDLARGSASRFTFGPSINAAPVWSPDGSRIIFRKLLGGQIEFFEKSAAGGGDEVSILSGDSQHAAGLAAVNLVPTDWSPDGRNLIYSVPALVSGYDLWLLPLVGDQKPVKFLTSPADQMHANFSPDGRLVAYTSNESGRYEVYIQTFPLSDRKWQVSISGGYEPRWRADGREIYYLSEDRKLMAVAVAAGPSFDAPKALFQTRVPSVVHPNRMHYVPTRDGRRFLINVETRDTGPAPITVVLNWPAAVRK